MTALNDGAGGNRSRDRRALTAPLSRRDAAEVSSLEFRAKAIAQPDQPLSFVPAEPGTWVEVGAEQIQDSQHLGVGQVEHLAELDRHLLQLRNVEEREHLLESLVRM